MNKKTGTKRDRKEKVALLAYSFFINDLEMNEENFYQLWKKNFPYDSIKQLQKTSVYVKMKNFLSNHKNEKQYVFWIYRIRQRNNEIIHCHIKKIDGNFSVLIENGSFTKLQTYEIIDNDNQNIVVKGDFCTVIKWIRQKIMQVDRINEKGA